MSKASERAGKAEDNKVVQALLVRDREKLGDFGIRSQTSYGLGREPPLDIEGAARDNGGVGGNGEAGEMGWSVAGGKARKGGGLFGAANGYRMSDVSDM